MTNASRPPATERTGGNEPRAIIHKQILGVAADEPDASMEAIADEVSGVTASTVERVLEEYGDPAAEGGATEDGQEDPDSTPTPTGEERTVTDGGAAPSETDAGGNAVSSTDVFSASDTAAVATDSSPRIDPASLTQKQAETLRAIRKYPDATQAELADMLGVSSPTISQRVNSIEGFDWTDRGPIVAELVDAGALETNGGGDDGESDSSTLSADDAVDSTGTDAGDPSTATADPAVPPSGTGFGTDGDESPEKAKPTDATTDRIDSSRADGDDANEATPGDADQDDRIAVDRRELEALRDRVDALTEQVADLEDGHQPDVTDGVGESPLTDPELAHKVVHACMTSDRITEEEELRLLRAATAAGVGGDGRTAAER